MSSNLRRVNKRQTCSLDHHAKSLARSFRENTRRDVCNNRRIMNERIPRSIVRSRIGGTTTAGKDIGAIKQPLSESRERSFERIDRGRERCQCTRPREIIQTGDPISRLAFYRFDLPSLRRRRALSRAIFRSVAAEFSVDRPEQ